MSNRITNVQCDREIILLWLGDKSPTTQVSYRSTVEKFLQFIDKPLSEKRDKKIKILEIKKVAFFNF